MVTLVALKRGPYIIASPLKTAVKTAEREWGKSRHRINIGRQAADVK